MKKMKRTVAIVLMALMVLGLFAGCGPSSADLSQEVTLKWVVSYNEQKEADLVHEAFNKELAKLLPNTKVEFIYASMKAQWPLWMAGREPLDISCTFGLDISQEIDNGSYLELDDLIAEYAPNIQKEKEILTKAYGSATVDGSLYAIPNEQPLLHQSASLDMKAKYYPYFPVDEMVAETNANYKTTEKVYQLIEQYVNKLLAENLVEKGRFVLDVQNMLTNLATRGYDFVGNTMGTGAWLCYDSKDPNAKVMSFMQTEEYKMFIRYTSKWYDMGWIPDSYGLSQGGVALEEVLTAKKVNNWYNIDDPRGVRYEKDADGNVTNYYVLTDKEDAIFNGANIIGSELTYVTIPFTSKNPERAMMLLNLLHDEPGTEGNKLLNLLCYGFEKDSEYAKEYGTYHYTLDTTVEGIPVANAVDYTVQATGQSKYGIPHWVVGNVYKTYRTPNILDGQIEWAMNFTTEVEPALSKTALYGFSANLSPVSNNVNQVTRALSEYLNTLSLGGGGAAKYTENYNKMIDKMNAAGLEKVIKEVQSQADKFMG